MKTPETMCEASAAVLHHFSLAISVCCLLGVATRLRQSELFALKWKDVDFENGQLRFTRSNVHQVVGSCKTEASQTKASAASRSDQRREGAIAEPGPESERT